MDDKNQVKKIQDPLLKSILSSLIDRIDNLDVQLQAMVKINLIEQERRNQDRAYDEDREQGE